MLLSRKVKSVKAVNVGLPWFCESWCSSAGDAVALEVLVTASSCNFSPGYICCVGKDKIFKTAFTRLGNGFWLCRQYVIPGS